MKTARDIMTPNPVTAARDTDIVEAARTMLERRFNGLPVVEDGKLVGMITQSDLVALQKRLELPSVFTVLDGFIPLSSTDDMEEEIRKIAAATVGAAMTADPVTVGPEATVEEMATLMAEKKIHTLPVVEGGSLVGVVGKEDILRTLLPSKDAE